MKKTLLTIISLFSLHYSYAQTYTSQYGDSVTAVAVPGDFDISNPIKNTTSSDIYLKWNLESQSLPTGWTFSAFCDNKNCYTGPITGSFISDPYAPNVFGSFKATLNADAAANNTTGWVRIATSDTVNSYSKTYTFIAHKWPTGISNVTRTDDDVVVFPNPARNTVNVIFEANLGVKNITIYNLIGKAISVYKVNGTSAKLDIENIPSGIYFIRLINGQGQIVATRKFTHQ
jgi:hypothetical protein